MKPSNSHPEPFWCNRKRENSCITHQYDRNNDRQLSASRIGFIIGHRLVFVFVGAFFWRWHHVVMICSRCFVVRIFFRYVFEFLGPRRTWQASVLDFLSLLTSSSEIECIEYYLGIEFAQSRLWPCLLLRYLRRERSHLTASIRYEGENSGTPPIIEPRLMKIVRRNLFGIVTRNVDPLGVWISWRLFPRGAMI